MQNEYGDTALFGACRGGHVETARVLLDHRANVDLQNNVRKNDYNGVLVLLNMHGLFSHFKSYNC